MHLWNGDWKLCCLRATPEGVALVPTPGLLLPDTVVHGQQDHHPVPFPADDVVHVPHEQAIAHIPLVLPPVDPPGSKIQELMDLSLDIGMPMNAMDMIWPGGGRTYAPARLLNIFNGHVERVGAGCQRPPKTIGTISLDPWPSLWQVMPMRLDVTAVI